MKKSTLLAALILVAVSGLLLHARIHFFLVADKVQPGGFIFDRALLMATFFPLIDVLAVTYLFLSRRTALYGYLLNGFIVIYGTIFMAHYSIAEMAAKSLPFYTLFWKSTLPDIGIAWGDFFIGKTLYDYYTTSGE